MNATMTESLDLTAVLDAIDLQLTADSDEVVLPRGAAVLVACALHDLLGQPREGGCAVSRMSIDLEAIKARAKAATPGPWWHEWVDGDDWWAVYGQPTGDMVCPEVATLDREKWCTADAEFISHARTDLPRLAAAIEAVLDLHDHDDQFHCLTVKVIAAALEGEVSDDE